MSSNYQAAQIGAVEAGRYIGEEPVAVTAPVEAQIAIAHALLAVADAVRDLRSSSGRPDFEALLATALFVHGAPVLIPHGTELPQVEVTVKRTEAGRLVSVVAQDTVEVSGG